MIRKLIVGFVGVGFGLVAFVGMERPAASETPDDIVYFVGDQGGSCYLILNRGGQAGRRGRGDLHVASEGAGGEREVRRRFGALQRSYATEEGTNGVGGRSEGRRRARQKVRRRERPNREHSGPERQEPLQVLRLQGGVDQAQQVHRRDGDQGRREGLRHAVLHRPRSAPLALSTRAPPKRHGRSRGRPSLTLRDRRPRARPRRGRVRRGHASRAANRGSFPTSRRPGSRPRCRRSS